MRQVFLFLVLAALVVIPFLIWGDPLMQQFELEGSINWIKSFGPWAWMAGIGLLISDLILPIPGTIVMAALGYIYGVAVGGFVSALGSFLSGSLAYWCCRALGEKAARKILGDKGFTDGTRTFNKVGGWLVVLSRWLPIFPEVIACMAGLNRMSIRKFHLALLASAIPMGFVYAIIGYSGQDNPIMAVAVSALLPPTIWLIIRPIFNRHRKGERNLES